MNNKILYGLFIAVVILIGLNLFFLFGGKGHHLKRQGHKESPQGHIAKMLHFDEKQQVKLKEEFDIHPPLVEAELSQIKELKSQIHLQVQGDERDEIVDSLSNEIGNSVKEIEILFYNHFKRVKMICTPDQEVYFNEWLEKMEERREGRPNFGTPPPRRKKRK